MAAKFNLDALLAKLAEIGKRLSSSSPLALRSTDELQDDYAATDSLLIVATGTVLNIVKSRQQGNSLHVIVRHGEVISFPSLITCILFIFTVSVFVTNDCLICFCAINVGAARRLVFCGGLVWIGSLHTTELHSYILTIFQPCNWYKRQK